MTAVPNLYNLTKYEIKEILDELKRPVEIAVVGSGNEFNFGSIIRTAHSFLVKKIYAIDMEWFYKKSAVTTLKWEKDNIVNLNSNDFLEQTKNKNIVAFEMRPGLMAKNISDYCYPDNPILLFGGEKFGIPDNLIKAAKDVVCIPLYGLSNDLNVACAAGIGLYDFTIKYNRLNK